MNVVLDSCIKWASLIDSIPVLYKWLFQALCCSNAISMFLKEVNDVLGIYPIIKMSFTPKDQIVLCLAKDI